MKKEMKSTIIRLIVLCMLMPVAMPILAYADSGNWSLVAGNEINALSIAPYENELGLMANAADLANALSLDYEFDSQNKCFTINDDVHGTIMLMHNATQYYSGDKTYDCAPYFYVENGVPMAETNFFCTMFGASFSYNKDDKKLTVTKNADTTALSPLSEELNPASDENPAISLYGTSPTLSGRISVENKSLIPASGIDVDLILQTRSRIYTWTSVYGDSHSEYRIGEIYTLGTTHISKEKGYGEYSYSLSRHYSDKYPLYTLFYSSTDNDFLEHFGYFVGNSTIQVINTPPMYYEKEKHLYPTTWELKSSLYACLTLPEKSSRPTKPITQLRANIESGYVAAGTVITLSCDTSNAVIYYTTDGTPPSRTSRRYTSGITVDRPITIKAIAITPNGNISDIVTYTYNTINSTNPLITAGRSIGKPGQTVDVNVSLSNNPGIASMRLNVGYNSSVLTLAGVVDSGKLGRQIHSGNYAQNPYVLCWSNSLAADYAADGDVVTLKFKINDNAAEGNYPITVSYDNTNDDIFNAGLDLVDFSISDGNVTVSETAPDILVNADIAECKFTDNKLSAKINFYSCLTDCMAILAVYDNSGRLLDTTTQSVTAGDTSTALELTSEKNLAGSEVKVFFRKSLADMNPVGNALKCTASKQ